MSWIEDQGLNIWNGATKGDNKSEWIQVGQKGCITIDYVVRNEERRARIERILEGNRIKSDHSPMEMRIKWNGDEEKPKWKKKKKVLRKVIKWDEERVNEYRSKLEGHGEAMNWRELKEKALLAISGVEVRGYKEEYFKDKWRDAECHKKKEDLNKTLEVLRKGGIEKEEEKRKTGLQELPR